MSILSLQVGSKSLIVPLSAFSDNKNPMRGGQEERLQNKTDRKSELLFEENKQLMCISSSNTPSPVLLIHTSPCFCSFFSVVKRFAGGGRGGVQSSDNTFYSWPYALSSVANMVYQAQRIINLVAASMFTSFAHAPLQGRKLRPGGKEMQLIDTGNGRARQSGPVPCASHLSALCLLQM